jgi:catechol-2,3-dioxygenase
MISKELKESIGIHHIVFTVSSAVKSQEFYTKIFGKPNFANLQTAIYSIGQTMLILIEKDLTSGNSKFNPNIIGLDHVAFGLKGLNELQQIEMVLTENYIEHSGIHIDNSSHKEKIWLNDPSNIRIEFYL